MNLFYLFLLLFPHFYFLLSTFPLNVTSITNKVPTVEDLPVAD